MADPRFFSRAGPFSIEQLGKIGEADLHSPKRDADKCISDVGALDLADEGTLSFLDNRKYIDALKESRAGACVMRPDHASAAPPGMAVLVSADPYRAYARIAQAFYPRAPVVGGIAQGAYVAPGAIVDASAQISENAVIGDNATIGPRSMVGPNAVIGSNVVIGSDCRIGPNASVSHAIIGDRVILYAGVRIGQDGFGFAMGASGHVRVPQLGRVIIEDDVEIGANSTIDRGAGPDTVIRRGVMIDNLVQIGHNVDVGEGSVLVSQSGVSGSTKLGHHVVLAAQAGITGHLSIGAGARVAAQSGVMRDVGPGEDVCGSPAVPVRQFFRQVVALTRLGKGKEK